MPNIEDFRAFYNEELLPLLDELEHMRRSILIKNIKTFFFFLGVGITAWIILSIWIKLTHRYYENYILVYYAALVIPMIAYIYKRKKPSSFFWRYNHEIIGGIVRFIEPSLYYKPESYIPFSSYRHSSLFDDNVDAYTGSDYIYGRVGNTNIWFSQIHAEKEEESYSTDDDGNTTIDTYWVTIFKGIFFVADFNKDFDCTVILRPRRRNIIELRRDDEIILDYPEFMKYFSVYTDDIVEARYVLSTSLMKRIVELRKNAKRDIYISFVPPNIYVAIPCNPLFYATYCRSIVDYKKMELYFYYLSFTIGIVEELGLNRRIWGKKALSSTRNR